ncbi:glycosyltransferase family 4 protein [Halorarius halobius]|uniref:glycosyltransferase family 4 protein n=1 Tax=Halorarius halobius TaxID=2962671 RepID=UPI0020CF9A72|nr:glycosyltransferase family 4 protein [Halorarius halobius]
MRVAVVASETTQLSDRQGVARTVALAEALAARGHEVRVFCTQWWDGYDTVRAEDGVTYHAVTVAPARTSFVARVGALVARFRPDAVHATPAPPGGVLSARLGASLARAPLVVDWYGDEPLDDSRTRDAAARVPDRVLCPSEFVESRVWEQGVPEDATQVLPEFVDFDVVRATDPVADPPEVVFARRLDDDCNLESLLLALAELRDRDWTAAVVGDGPEREAYEQQAADLRIDDRVEFHGSLDRERRIALYRGAHVFVHTALREQFASELLWGLACGCVGIVEYQAESAAHELVERRERGFRVTTPEEIADAIVEAGELGRRSVDETMTEYGREQVLGDLLDCYRSLGAGG